MASENSTDPKAHKTQVVSGHSRRRALKKLAAGTGLAAGAAALPGKWTQPLADRVLVPAHAQTSGDPIDFASDIEIQIEVMKQFATGPDENRMEKLVQAILPDAHAQPTATISPPSAIGALCIKSQDNGTKFDAKLLVQTSTLLGGSKVRTALNGAHPYPYFFEISGASVGAAAVEFPFSDGCTFEAIVKIKVDSFSTAGAQYAISGFFNSTGLLPVGTSCPKALPCPNNGNASDIRLKNDIHPLESTGDGVQLYRFRYTADRSKQVYVGVMAQDLITSHPEAVVKNPDGYLAVRYDLLGLKMTTYEAWQKQGFQAVKLPH